MPRLTRKEFLGLFLGRGLPGRSGDPDGDRPEPGGPGLDPLWADFPAEWLAEEVRGLGLDPDGLDRAAMLAAVRRVMLEQNTPREAATEPLAARESEAAGEEAAVGRT